jgi:phosphate/sulfate permease
MRVCVVLVACSSVLAVNKGTKLSMDTAWLVLGADNDHEGRPSAIDRLAPSTVTPSPSPAAAGISRPASPDRQREAPLLAGGGSGGSDGLEAGVGAPTILPRQSTAAERVDVAEAQFTGLLVLTGCTVAFAHGGNDVGNSTGPLLIALAHSGGEGSWLEEGLWLPVLGGLCFVLGIVTVGSRTISTVGSKITKLTQSTAFAVQSGATLAVLLSTAVGLPVSTSHCLVGALIGTGVAGKYTSSNSSSGGGGIAGSEQEAKAPSARNAPLDLTVLKKIVLAWCASLTLTLSPPLRSRSCVRSHFNL